MPCLGWETRRRALVVIGKSLRLLTMASGIGSLIRMAAKGTNWSDFLDYASPALFEVMPVRALSTQCRELISNGSDDERFSRALRSTAVCLRDRGIEVDVGRAASQDARRPLAGLAEGARREAGQRVLEIYFAQVFGNDQAILDLRAESFSCNDSAALSWNPRAIYVQWQPEFLDGLRDLYGGFYLEEPRRLERGLNQLGMNEGRDALLGLLGRDNPRGVRFDTAEFHRGFHDMFLRYRDRGVALHRNFLALGIYLVCVYNALESLELAFDVARAVERAQ